MTPQVDTLAADSRERAVTALLKYPPLRRLWGAQLVGGIGDALSVLVLVLLGMQAAALTGNFGDGYRGVGLAVAAVFGVRMLATLLFGAVLLGPMSSLTGAEGPLDRRLAMVGADVVRAGLLLVAPLWITWTPDNALGWLLVTAFVCGVAERLWTIAKDSAAPGLLPAPPAEGAAIRPLPDHYHALRRLSLRTTYVSLPIAAAGLVAVTLISNLLGSGIGWFHDHQAALASYLAAGLFAASLSVLYFVEFPRGGATRARSPLEGLRRPKVNGAPDKGRTGAVPTLVVTAAAVAGAIAASVAIAVLQAYDLGGGPVAFGLLVLALTGGPVIGVRTAGRILPALSRRRLLALATAVAGVALLAVGLVPDPVTGLLLALLAGIAAGAAAATGHDLLDQETEEARRARLTGHLHAVVRLTLGAVAIVAPLLAAAIGQHRAVSGDFVFAHGGAAFAFLLIGALLLPVAALVLARIDDRQGVPLRQDLRDALRRGTEPAQAPSATGFFIAVEGGDGAGKSTQTEALAEWIRGKGHDVVVTREPGATSIGQRLRSILLDVSSAGISHRAEALLYAADRAEHVDSVVRPALERGAVVITDRYIDSSVAYQGAGRELSPTEVARISRWATGGLVPHLTVLLDISPDAARERFTEAPDRLESEPAEFHQRVRSGFLALAAADPARYLVVDAAQDAEGITTVVRHRLDQLLPLSGAEARAQEEARRRAEEDRKRREAEEAARKAEEERLERERQEQLARLRAEEEERMRREIEEARQREAEREAELARQRAEEARRLAEEERKRREAEEAAYRTEQDRLRRLAEEQARLRAEAEERRIEKQRRAEEALLRAERARQEAEATRSASGPGGAGSGRGGAGSGRGGAASGQGGAVSGGGAASGPGGAASGRGGAASGQGGAASGPDAETTQPLPQARQGEVGFDAAAEGEPSDARPSDAGPSDAEPSDAEPSDGVSSEASPNAATTQRLPQASDANPDANADPDADETRVIPQVPDPDAQETQALPQVPDPDAQETRALPQVPDHPDAQETQEMPQGSTSSRRNRDRPSWAEETPLDDLPSLADELLGPHEDDDDSRRRRR